MSDNTQSPIAQDRNRFMGIYHSNKSKLNDSGDMSDSERKVRLLEAIETEITKEPLSQPEVEIAVTRKFYKFISDNNLSFKPELETLEKSIDTLEEQDEQPFVLYAYYLSYLMEDYCRAYGQYGEADKHLKLRENYKKRFLQGRMKIKPEPDKSIIQAIKKYIKDSAKSLVSFPFHVKQMKGKIGLNNVRRIHWTFCRISSEQFLLVLKSSNVLSKFDQLAGTVFDIDSYISKLDSTKMITNPLSVGFFASRCVLNILLVLKHTLFPSEKEKEIHLLRRFAREIHKRRFDFVNDIVWASVNLITNYNYLFRISGALAGWITVVFLIFDMAVWLWRLKSDYDNYKLKTKEFDDQILFYKNEIVRMYRVLQAEKSEQKKNELSAQYKLYQDNIDLLNQQKKQLDINWQAQKEMLLYGFIGGFLLFSGFTASMLVGPAWAVPLCFYLVMVGVALYLTCDDFYAYRLASKNLDLARSLGQDTQQLQRSKNIAMAEWIFCLFKYSVMPSLIITSFAIFWPAAVVLTLAFLGLEIGHKLVKYKMEHPKAGFFKSAPKEDPVISSELSLEDPTLSSSSVIPGEMTLFQN